MLNIVIVGVVLAVGLLLLHPRLVNAPLWRATMTPLASIIGSGFLVIGPILHGAFGVYSPVAMLALCAVAYLFGHAIRFNIAVIGDGSPQRSPRTLRVETVASWSLAFAYVISVAYYLNLFGAFALSLTPMDDPFSARLVASGVFLVILFVGWTQGFAALERLEQITVGIKLAIIAGLLAGLIWYFVAQFGAGQLAAEPPKLGGWAALTLGFGLIVTVQGFETSRYLGDSYDAQTRINSMRLAQLLSAAIYLVYIILLTLSFSADQVPLQETAIIDMMGIVAPILSVLLVAAALSAQFSAAVADASGSGGLIGELTSHRVPQRHAYALLVGCGLILTWTSDVFDIISYASRAFAVYYALQAGIAALSSWNRQGASVRTIVFASLAILGGMIAVFGVAVE